jgi:Flp pilus assembly protein TadB
MEQLVTFPGESQSDYRLMTGPEKRLAVKMAKRIHKLQGRPEALVSGAYLMMTATWVSIGSCAGLVFVFVGVAGHHTLVSLIFGLLTAVAAVYMCLRFVQYRRTLEKVHHQGPRD